MKPVTISVSTFCSTYSVQKTTAYKWIRLGLIESALIGGKRLIKVESVEALFERASREGQVQ